MGRCVYPADSWNSTPTPSWSNNSGPHTHGYSLPSFFDFIGEYSSGVENTFSAAVTESNFCARNMCVKEDSSNWFREWVSGPRYCTTENEAVGFSSEIATLPLLLLFPSSPRQHNVTQSSFAVAFRVYQSIISDEMNVCFV